MKTIAPKALLVAIAVALSSLAAGCNTMEGLGQDTQAGGRALERSADRNK